MLQFRSSSISLINLFIDFLKENKKTRNVFVFIVSIIFVLFILALIFKKQIFNEENITNAHEFLLVGLATSGFLLFLSITSYTNIKLISNEYEEEIDDIRKERVKIKESIKNQADNVLSTIQLSLNQLNEYYTINLNQAKSSYRWSIFAIIIGLITLLTGVWLIYFNENPNYNLAILTGISGIIIEFIGASNIYIYIKSVKQLNIYFKELIKIQDTMLAIELCDEIKGNHEKKLEITEKIIISLMTRSSS